MEHVLPNDAVTDSFEILGLPADADEHQVRARFLELVKQFPPERFPEQFQRIQSAFDTARDPLAVAKSMLVLPDDDNPPDWQDVIDAHVRRRPAMGVPFLLSLGNSGEWKSPHHASLKLPDGTILRVDQADSPRSAEAGPAEGTGVEHA